MIFFAVARASSSSSRDFTVAGVTCRLLLDDLLRCRQSLELLIPGLHRRLKVAGLRHAVMVEFPEVVLVIRKILRDRCQVALGGGLRLLGIGLRLLRLSHLLS